MEFTLNIETDNAAFTDQPAAEIARILQDVAHYLTAGSIVNLYSMKLRDINGNTVGRWEYTPARLEWECPRCHCINEDDRDETGEMTCFDCHYTADRDEVSA